MFINKLYKIFVFSFKIGDFLGRSSLKIIKWKRLGILIIIQFCNFLFWLSIVICEFELNYFFSQTIYIYLLFSLLFVFMGLISGVIYVNSCYSIMNESKCTGEQKELAMNSLTFTADMSILFASIISVILSETVFKIHN